MDGGNAVGKQGGSSVDLPSILARLDSEVASERRAAVADVVAHVEDAPDACLPTVPKLRSLLADDLECHTEIADCLATLAAYSPADVAPSVDEIVAFVLENPTDDATPALVRALEAVAGDRPTALTDHVDAAAVALESDDPAARAAGARILEHLATETETSLESMRERLTDLATDDPNASVRERAAAVLEHLER
ncbi:hypothetical protein [Natrarchaeobaculum aegyptiacum]|uniref:Uncharacterized protein n=1 Tax=Natrarchaeobaculum aegyptiacum TaxID=745377 RepID=A0A2Z2HUE4_9EURY|nr:hypothetical protein [Natrarchaeobaculum aegyptiacum]ARS90393.1 hypothetical protein B1756_12090 [Natrarchaeobaculum aegyptiacum]